MAATNSHIPRNWVNGTGKNGDPDHHHKTNPTDPGLSMFEVQRMDDAINHLHGYKNKADVVASAPQVVGATLVVNSLDGGRFKWVLTSNYTDTGNPYCGLFISVGGGTAGWERDYEGNKNVRWWGAYGGAGIDNYTQLQQAWDTKGNIDMHDGPYAISQMLKYYSYTKFNGTAGVTKIIPLDNTYPDEFLAEPAREINAKWTGYFTFNHVSFENTSTNFGFSGLSVAGAVWEWYLNNTQHSDFGRAGLWLDGSYRGVINNIGVYDCAKTGGYSSIEFLDKSGTDRCSNIKFIGGNIQNTPVGVHAVKIMSGTGITFDTTVFQSNGYGVIAYGTANLTMNNCYHEDLDREIRLEKHPTSGAPCGFTKFNNPQFVKPTYTNPILLQGDEDTVFNDALSDGSNKIFIIRTKDSKRTVLNNCPRLYFSDSKSNIGYENIVKERFIGSLATNNISVPNGTPTFGAGEVSVLTVSNLATIEKLGEDQYVKNNLDVEVVCRISDFTNNFFRPISLDGTATKIRLECSTSATTNNFVLGFTGSSGDQNHVIPFTLDTDYHSYRLRVSYDKVELLIDGVLFKTITDTNYIPVEDSYMTLSSYVFSPAAVKTMYWKGLNINQDFR